LRITRFYCPELPSSGEFALAKDEVAHLTRVLRLKKGAHIEVFDGRGRAALCELTEIQRRHAQAKVLHLLVKKSDKISLTIAVAPAKGRRMTFLVEKLTELGVGEILPLRTEFGQLEEGQIEKERDGWIKKSIEAAKQCGQNTLPIIPASKSVAELCESYKGQGFVASPTNNKPLWTRLSSLKSSDGPFLMAVGPEGGFSEAEKAFFRDAGFESVTIGSLILRIETAALATASLFLGRFSLPDA
jgi:16S rRNA (uracil1498-N3)-methyltransferase